MICQKEAGVNIDIFQIGFKNRFLPTDFP